MPGYKTPNEKFDEEFADLSSNPVQQKIQQSSSSAGTTSSGYKTPNEKFDEEFADLNSQPVKKKIQQSQSKKQSK